MWLQKHVFEQALWACLTCISLSKSVLRSSRATKLCHKKAAAWLRLCQISMIKANQSSMSHSAITQLSSKYDLVDLSCDIKCCSLCFHTSVAILAQTTACDRLVNCFSGNVRGRANCRLLTVIKPELWIRTCEGVREAVRRVKAKSI